MNECYYKTLTIHLDDIVAIIFQKGNLPCQGPWQGVCSCHKRIAKIESEMSAKREFRREKSVDPVRVEIFPVCKNISNPSLVVEAADLRVSETQKYFFSLQHLSRISQLRKMIRGGYAKCLLFRVQLIFARRNVAGNHK